MRYLSILGLGLFCFCQGYADSLTNKIDTIINKELPNATVSILIKDAKNGRLIYSKNANKLLSPASNMKLFTAAAALYYWPPEHYFETKLLKKKDNYYIYFGGSPSLTAENLSSLIIGYCKAHHLTEIKGTITLDTSLFKPPYYSNGVSYDDLGWYFTAPDTAVILNENTANYEMTTTNLGKPVLLKPQKEAQNKLTIINEAVTVSPEDEKNHCGLNIEILPHNTLRLFGCAAQDKHPKLLQFAIPDPVFLAQHVIKNALNQNGIQFKGQIIEGKTPSDAILLNSLKSNALAKLIDHMLKESDNLYADNLTKQLAYSLTHEATNKQAVFALKKILSQHIALLDMQQIELADGIGTRYNLATAEQITILLTNIYHNKTLFPLLFSALPQSGVSGTLKDRMKNTPLEKIVYAKTGTMHDISSLSGYLINPHGKPIIFSILINGINKPIMKAKLVEEKILTVIDQEVNADVQSSAYV